jgi:hypothetical protein
MKRTHLLPGALAALALLAASWLIAPFLPRGVDWVDAFRPAAWELLSFRSPYNVAGFFNPPWALIPLLPLALLPEAVGRAALALVTLASVAYTAHRLGGSKIAVVFVLISPPVMHGLLNANIDWLALLGFVLPPWLGLFFVSTKPQIGVAVVLFWLVEAWRQGGWRQVFRTFWPVTLAGLLSLLLFGPWPLRSQQEVALWWNASLWPLSIPLGLVLVVAALRRRKIEYAMAAAPCLSPYVLFHSWVGVLMAVVASTPETIAAVVGLWILIAMKILKLG